MAGERERSSAARPRAARQAVWAGIIKQNAQRPSRTLRVVCGNKKAGAGVLSGMVFLLTRTTRTRQRWRDGEGALGSCLHRDVAAINKMHFRCERYRAATSPHKNKPNRRSRPNKHCLALPVSARTSGRCRAQASGRCAGMQVYPRQGVAVRTGAAMPLLHLAAGGWGALAGKRPPHKPRSDQNKTRLVIDRHDHAAKSEGAAQHQPRFAAPHRR